MLTPDQSVVLSEYPQAYCKHHPVNNGSFQIFTEDYGTRENTVLLSQAMTSEDLAWQNAAPIVREHAKKREESKAAFTKIMGITKLLADVAHRLNHHSEMRDHKAFKIKYTEFTSLSRTLEESIQKI